MGEPTDGRKRLVEPQGSHDEPDFEPRGGGYGDD